MSAERKVMTPVLKQAVKNPLLEEEDTEEIVPSDQPVPNLLMFNEVVQNLLEQEIAICTEIHRIRCMMNALDVRVQLLSAEDIESLGIGVNGRIQLLERLSQDNERCEVLLNSMLVRYSAVQNARSTIIRMAAVHRSPFRFVPFEDLD
jgi:hypothetical protein